MTFRDRIFRRTKKGNNFKYLDDLVNSDKKEVKLTADIELDFSEYSLYGEGISIETDGLTVDGDGHIIDARHRTRIFNVENKEVTFKNITFLNGTAIPEDASIDSLFNSLQGGGAFHAFESKVSFINCTFRDNVDNRGGAIFLGYSQAVIEDCRFIKNTGREFAGAIFNDDDSSLTVINSEFNNNVAFDKGNDIRSVESSLKVIDCKFSNGNSDKQSIDAAFSGNFVLKNSLMDHADVNVGNMAVIKDCEFRDSVVNVKEQGNLYIPEAQKDAIPFSGNNIHYLGSEMDWVRELSEHELAREFLRYFPESDGCESGQPEMHDEMSGFVEIWRQICSYDANFIMADAIVNVSKLTSEEIKDKYSNISKEGANDNESFDRLYNIFENALKSVDFPARNFRNLDDLIHNGGNITLTSDIILDEGEIEEYADGIKIDVDDVVINGENHVIDAGGKVSIFNIDARNVTVKNLIFKNAFSHMGGAVSNIGEVEFINCRFHDNIASELGGAIVNDEKMTIIDCEFESNLSGGVGGAIAATFASDLVISQTKFFKNKISLKIECPGEILPIEAQGFGGAIYNNGKLHISDAEFRENSCEKSGGAMIVLPDSKIKIENSLFRDNHAGEDGGVLHTMGEINIYSCEFKSNTAKNSAGVFDATESSKLKISNSKFENNAAEKGNVMVNKGKLELAGTRISDEDVVDETLQTLLGESEEMSGDGFS